MLCQSLSKLKYIVIITLVFLPHALYSQDNWVSISNEFLKVSLDPQTGRYIIADAQNPYLPKITSLNAPEFIVPLTPVQDKILSENAILGQIQNALNFTTLNINGTPIVFGSPEGRWLSVPIISEARDQILYAWRLGDVDILQIISIIKNPDTLLNDAVSVTYQFRNNSGRIQKIGARLVLDPTPGDGQDIPFMLPGDIEINTETELSSSDIPEYWFSTDQSGQLSPYTVRGILQSSRTTKPDRILFTSLNNALSNPWTIRHNPRNLLSDQDTAVVMYYNPQELSPNSSRSITTIIGISGVINTSNNGLKINSSVMSAQDQNPIRLDFWVQNTSTEIFDQVNLDLKIPPGFNMLSSNPKTLEDLGPQSSARFVGWKISSINNTSSTFQATLTAQGLRNGNVVATLNIPITFTIESNMAANEEFLIKETAAQTLETLQNEDNIPSISLVLEGFMPEDTYGSTSENLDALYQYFADNTQEDSSYIIKIIETERQLLEEIREAERNINEVNQQYKILRSVYKQLYENKNTIDSYQINIQQVQDKLNSTEEKLKTQQQSYSNLTKKFDSSAISWIE
ncbi:hypothetical protein SAMN02745150_00952 [Brevinema andersonii]|uniref:DUF11 domain-containing protein n=1 Tax=Brevinema andersonii TaxID=34097 RepID=A0A1I1E4Z0_BREAD|nr:hypothetical protein [Brevinema andersonii]SFB82231.1 hypothetical protein SAMN02745150_00952 [Brevinema andersonii]